MEINGIEKRIEEMLNRLEGIVDQVYLDDVRGYFHYNETKLGTEILCDHIAEFGFVLPGLIYEELVSICKILNIGENYYGVIEVDRLA